MAIFLLGGWGVGIGDEGLLLLVAKVGDAPSSFWLLAADLSLLFFPLRSPSILAADNAFAIELVPDSDLRLGTLVFLAMLSLGRLEVVFLSRSVLLV